MSLIYAKIVEEDKFLVYCEACHVRCDAVSTEELVGMVRGGYRVFCRGCEGRCEEYPEVFRWEGEPFTVVIDGLGFRVEWGHIEAVGVHPLACLVSTYLHKQQKNGVTNV